MGNHLSLRVRTNALLDGISPKVLDLCMKEIFDTLFGSNEKLLDFIMKSVTMYKLEVIHAIIKREKLKLAKKEQNDETDIKQTQISYFNSLPNEIIRRITKYLPKREVACRFNKTSRQISSVCLEKMTKSEIGIINANNYKLAIDNKAKSKEYRLGMNTASFSRYSSSITLNSLFSLW